jgi:parallel beta-helix repeat protein
MNCLKLLFFSCIVIALELLSPQTVSAAPATDCTIYASPNGGGNGSSSNSPTTLGGAYQSSQAGSVICFMPGTHLVNSPQYLNKSGTPTGWIIWKSYDAANRATIKWNSTTKDDFLQLSRYPATAPYPAYYKFQNLIFDGANQATNGIHCKGCHHVTLENNHFTNMRASGIATTERSDYITVINNTFHHIGNYSTDGGNGWGSAITLNTQGWYDRAPGFHSIVANNIMGGVVDGSQHNSDGNGIIIDLGGNQGGTPPVLITNNVVYMNGGRCIHTLDSGNAWIVNNTCYKNSLDSRVTGGNGGNNGEYIFSGSSGNVLVNNIAYAWEDGRPLSDESGGQAGYGIGIYQKNIWFTSGNGPLYGLSSITTDPNKIKNADPQFMSPPVVTANGQYANAPHPDTIRDQFYLKAGSPALNMGVDPSTMTTDAALQVGLRQYTSKDIEGKPRVAGSWDLGAYETTATPTQPVTTQAPTITVPLASSYTLYEDALSSEWQNWSGSVVNYSNTSPVYSGTKSIAFTPPAWGTFDMANPAGFSTTPYTHIRFAARGSSDNQPFSIYFTDMSGTQLKPPVPLSNYGGYPSASAWKLYTIPLSDLNAQAKTIRSVVLHEWSGTAQPAVYFDALTFMTPATTTITSSPKLGDITRDGKVDVQDYNLLVTDFYQIGTMLRSDINNSGKVDVQDYNILVTNFGT